MVDQYLAFVSRAGETIDGKFIYTFFFSQDPDIVWGEDWNMIPSIIPNLMPSMDTISIICDVVTERDFLLARENCCFAMQDCIDGIIALLFTRPREEELILHFGEEMDVVMDKLKRVGIEFSNIRNTTEEKEAEIIDNVINALDNIKDNDGTATGDFGDTPEDFDDNDLDF